MRRIAVVLSAAALAVPAAASASTVLVLDPSGVSADHPAALGPPDPGPRHAAPASAGATAAAAPLRRALSRLLATKAINRATFDRDVGIWNDAQRTLRRLKGTRFTQLRGVLAIADGIAARGLLTAGRLPSVLLTVARNRQWWGCGSVIGFGQRVRFAGSRLLFAAYPGYGIQIQWLGTFGFANGLFQSKDHDPDLSALVDELSPLAAPRAGGIAWEYLFPFDGGSPPWVSGLAQGTAIQALSRAAARLKRPELFATARSALGIFRAPPPAGVRDATKAGAHYLQYSFAPHLHVYNGFIQSLNGLFDFAKFANDDGARALFDAGVAEARLEVRASDTGSWSYYSSQRDQSTSDYHKLYRQFLIGLCERTSIPVFCTTADRFLADLRKREGSGPHKQVNTQPAKRNPLPPLARCTPAGIASA